MHLRVEQSQLATHLFTLFIRCPFGQAAGDCPFADIRALQSLELKFRLAEQMARHPQCPENVRNTHGVCYRKRLRTAIRPGATTSEARKIHQASRPTPQTTTDRL